jgi:hypothetical protein
MTKAERDKIRADLKLERWRATWTRGKSLRSCKAQIARLEAALRPSVVADAGGAASASIYNATLLLDSC